MRWKDCERPENCSREQNDEPCKRTEKKKCFLVNDCVGEAVLLVQKPHLISKSYVATYIKTSVSWKCSAIIGESCIRPQLDRGSPSPSHQRLGILFRLRNYQIVWIFWLLFSSPNRQLSGAENRRGNGSKLVNRKYEWYWWQTSVNSLISGNRASVNAKINVWSVSFFCIWQEEIRLYIHGL